MKKLLLICFITFIGCQSRQDKLLSKLKIEEMKELKLSLIAGDIRDSMYKNPALVHDTSFTLRGSIAEFDLNVQKEVVKNLKERIMLEK